MSKQEKGKRAVAKAPSRAAALVSKAKPSAKPAKAAHAKPAHKPAAKSGPAKPAHKAPAKPAAKAASKPAAKSDSKSAPAKSAHPAIKPGSHDAKSSGHAAPAKSKQATAPSAPTGLPPPRPLIGMPGRFSAQPPQRPPLIPAQHRPVQPPPRPAPAPAPAAHPVPFGHPDLIQPNASGKRPMVATSSSHPPMAVKTAAAAAKPGPARPPTKQPQQVARSFYWSDLREGDDLPPLAKPAIDRLQIARYAGAAHEFNRLQLDEPFAHSLGFRGTFAPGALAMGFVGQLLTDWLRRGHVRRLSARFVKIIWPGDELTCHGRVSELRKEKGACYADLELWAENQKGELVLRGQAICELYESPGVAPSPLGAPFSVERAQSGGLSRPPPPRRK